MVSVCIRILTQTSERIEKVKAGEIVAIASIHAVSMQLAENMIGCAIGRSSNPTLSATKSCPEGSMILRKVKQVRRVFLVFAGFILLLAAAVMMVTPGPGMLVIFLGLG